MTSSMVAAMIATGALMVTAFGYAFAGQWAVAASPAGLVAIVWCLITLSRQAQALD